MTSKNCDFCGMPVTFGFFGIGGTAKNLYLGQLHELTCCPECAKKYKKFVEFDSGRFGIKVENMLHETGEEKISRQELTRHFKTYYEEAQPYLQNNPMDYLAYSKYYNYTYKRGKRTDVVVFNTTEALLSKQKMEDVVKNFERTLGDNFRDLETYATFDKDKKPWPFTGADMAMLGYNSFGATMSENTMTGVRWTYLLRLTLNDPTVITYKPAVINGLVMFKTALLQDNERMSELAMIALHDLAADLGGDLKLVDTTV